MQWLHPSIDYLDVKWPAIAAVVIGYLLPYWMYLLVTRRIGGGAKMVAGLLLALTVGLFWIECPMQQFVRVTAVLLSVGYFALATLALFRHLEALARRKLMLFFVASVLYLLVPALVLRAFPDALAEAGVLLAIGWEKCLKAYSYGLRARAHHGRYDLSSCLLFMVVNPCVYMVHAPEPRPPALHVGWLGRFMLGIATVVGSYGITGVRSVIPRQPFLRLFHIHSLAGYIRAFGGAFLRWFAIYWGHSGRASIEISAMQLLGYPVPERYNHPYLATSPKDFWRRWNIYVVSWVRIHIFGPVTLFLRRRLYGQRSVWAVALGVLAAFVLIGLLHAYNMLLMRFSFNWGALTFFGTHALGLLIFEAVGRRVRGGMEQVRPGPLKRGLAVGTWTAAWLLMLHFNMLSHYMGGIASGQLAGISLEQIWSHVVGRLLLW